MIESSGRIADAPEVMAASYLYPGQLLVSAKPTRITTILGSCVSVCLCDPDRAVGGMNHFVLPVQLPKHEPSPRFGVVALESLLAQVVKAGGKRTGLRAKVFGGAAMMHQSGEGLGSKNVRLALSWLAENNIAVTAQSVGGVRGRKLVFRTDDGSVLVKEL